MSETSASTNTTQVSLEDVKRAVQEIELPPKIGDWVVIDPYGRMYKGSVQDMTRVLLAEHPLLKMPIGTPMHAAAEQEQQT